MGPWQTVLVSLFGALLASVASPYIVFRFNERQRQLEIYKIAYPEKFKAIREFMQMAHELEIDVINAAIDQQNNWSNSELVERVKRLRREADANEWLFGPDVVAAMQRIGSLMMDIAGPRIQISGDIELVREFRELNSKLANELHMTKLRNFF